MRRKHFLAAQAWYAISQGAPAFLNPFLNLFFTKLGIAPAQIGLLSALRPWISAPCGSLIAGLADRWGAHRPLLLACYLAVTWIQGLMALPVFASFGAMLALTIASSCVYTPSQILADAAVMAASDHPGDYGRLRTMASISWTAFAPLAGWVNSTFGIRVGIACYVAGSMLAVPAAWMLPVEALRRKVAPLIERVFSKEAEEGLPAPAVAAAAGLPELQRPLLAEEAPTPVTQRAGLARALAIVRYIEAITELGVAPPPGVGLYGFAALPLNYVSQHLAPAEEEPEAAASPGYSPFAGAAEPGSESPEFAAAVGGATPATAPSSPAPPPAGAALEAAAGGQPDWQQHELPRGRTVHGSYDALHSLGQGPGGQLQPPRPAGTLPRPVSAHDLGREVSLAQGLLPPPVRTRSQTLAVPAPRRPRQAAALQEEESSPEGFVVLRPHRHSLEGERTSSAEGAEEEEEEPLFPAEDLQAGEHAAAARQQLRQLHTAPSASALLRDVRGIRMPQQQAAPSAPLPPRQAGREVEQSPAAAAPPASMGSRAASGSDELPVSISPPGTGTADREAPPPAAPLAAEPAEAAGTPAYRSAALSRLAHIFGGAFRRRGSSEEVVPTPGSLRASSGGAEAGETESEAEADEEAGMAAAPAAFSGSGFTPVQRYLDYRHGKLERKHQRRQQREAAAAAEGREPEPPTPPPSSLIAGLFGLTPTLAAASALPLPAQPARQELMREALDLELLEARQDHDATGSMVVSMLSKKLERMAREARRQQRLQRRAARQRAKAAAAAAAGAPAAAAPPAGPEAGEAVLRAPQQRLSAVPEERPAVTAAAAAEPEQLGFGAALKRLLSDAQATQVVTFFSLCTILGFGHGIIGGFLFMHLAEMGGSELLMGAVLTANALPELPAFFYFGRILSAIGMYTVLFTATATLGLRIWAYSLLPRIGLNWIMPIEALHAVTYACGWSASAVNSSKIAPPGLEGTTQGLFQGLWTGVGCGLAGILGGVLYGSHGAEFLFRVSGLAILGCTAATAVPVLALRRRRKRRAREPIPSKESMDDLAALAQH
ncbi:hypothetical protein ABPG75_006396 [Micractinium tetrahymenae]